MNNNTISSIWKTFAAGMEDICSKIIELDCTDMSDEDRIEAAVKILGSMPKF